MSKKATKGVWALIHMLPNLILAKPGTVTEDAKGVAHPWNGGLTLGSTKVAIVPPEDPRLRSLCMASTQSNQLVHGFYDKFGREVRASALIARADHNLTYEALVDFRNAVATTFVLKARAHAATQENGSAHAWSDVFDLHPASISKSDRIIVQSAALTEWYADSAPFRGMPSPHVASASETLFPDSYLAVALARTWRHCYEGGRRSVRFARRLFRSLEVAYQASSVAIKNQGSLSDFGIQVALWVSALEILVRSQKARASLPAVLDLIGGFQWGQYPAGRRRRMLVGRSWRSLNCAQRGYVLMYRARNDFLHGNAVNWQSLVQGEAPGAVSIPRVAASVYRTGVVAYLMSKYPLDYKRISDEIAWEIMDKYTYSEAIMASIGGTKAREH